MTGGPIKKYVFARARFTAIHAWPACPHESVTYLRHRHRHEFHVEIRAEVQHNDRDVEFIMLKQQLEDVLRKWHNTDCGSTSCEQFAEDIAVAFKGVVTYVSVSEDGENGAIIEVT